MTNLDSFIGIELSRHFRNPNRMVWIIGFIIVVQLYSTYALVTARNLLNYSELDATFYKFLYNFLLSVYIQSLPVLILVISFDTYIQDPTIKLSAVAAVNRHFLFVGKGISIVILSFLIFVIELLFASIFVIWIYQFNLAILSTILNSLFSFTVIIFYFVIVFTMLILVVHKFTQDKLSTIVFPVLLFYVIPFLLSSALSFEVVHPTILNISPIFWVISFNVYVVFGVTANTAVWLFASTGFVSFVIMLITIRYYEFH